LGGDERNSDAHACTGAAGTVLERNAGIMHLRNFTDDGKLWAYGVALAQRAALDTRQQMSTAYEDQKNTEGFNLDSFLQSWRTQSVKAALPAQGSQNLFATSCTNPSAFVERGIA